MILYIKEDDIINSIKSQMEATSGIRLNELPNIKWNITSNQLDLWIYHLNSGYYNQHKIPEAILYSKYSKTYSALGVLSDVLHYKRTIDGYFLHPYDQRQISFIPFLSLGKLCSHSYITYNMEHIFAQHAIPFSIWTKIIPKLIQSNGK